MITNTTGDFTPKGNFPSTHWFQVQAAGDVDNDAGAAALERLVKGYWPPLLAHLRFKFNASDDCAMDWLQAFAEKKILEKNLIRHADRNHGRFRTFLLSVLDRFVIDEFRKSQSEFRNPGGGLVSIEEEPEANHIADGNADSDPFDLQWALAILERAERDTEFFYVNKGRKEMWEIFLHGVILPMKGEAERPSDNELAARLTR